MSIFCGSGHPAVCVVCERRKMYIVGCRRLLKVSGTTPFVYQLLMTLLVMVLERSGQDCLSQLVTPIC